MGALSFSGICLPSRSVVEHLDSDTYTEQCRASWDPRGRPPVYLCTDVCNAMDKNFDVQRSCKKKPHQYCSRCEYLLTQAHYVFNQDDSSRPIIEHFSTFEQMILGSQEDCHLCSILANYYIALEMDHGTRIFAQLNLDKSSVKCLHARWFRYGSIDGDNRTSPKQFDLSLQGMKYYQLSVPSY